MKKIMTMTLLTAAVLLSLASCKEKKAEDNGIIKTDYEAPKPTDPKATSVSTMSEEIEWVEGRHYYVTISGKADSTLSMVENEYGQKFIDNAIRVDVTRADSTLFFKETFTKESFANWLNKDYREKAILTSISFFGIEGDLLTFIVSLNHPEASEDESLDLLLQVDRHGGTSIKPFTYNDRDDLDVREQE